jgi:O-antigen/teichoic acid export membrane protein
MAGGMMVLAPEIVRVVFGEPWIPMTSSFIVLGVYGLERAVNSSIAPLLKAKGKPNILFYLTLLKLILLAAIIYPLTIRYGILGTSIASSIVAVVISLNALRPVARALSCPITKVVQPLAGPFMATSIMASILLSLKFLGWNGNNLLGLLGLVVVGLFVYLLSLYFIDRMTMVEIRQVILMQLKMTEAKVV